MAEFKIVEIVGRRMRKGKEECQVQWAVTWEPVDEEFRKGELYQEFIADLEKEARESDAKDADAGGDASSEEKEEDAKDVDEGGSASSEEKEEDAKKIKETKADKSKVETSEVKKPTAVFTPAFLDRYFDRGKKETSVGAKRIGDTIAGRPSTYGVNADGTEGIPASTRKSPRNF
jgi:hypothetical protein